MRKTHFLIYCFFLLFSMLSFSQENKKIDSLKLIVEIAKEDTQKIKAGIDLCNIYEKLKPDSAIKYYELLISLFLLNNFNENSFEKIKSEQVLYYGRLLQSAGWSYAIYKSNYKKAIDYSEKAIFIYNNIDKKNNLHHATCEKGKAFCFFTLGVTYKIQSNYSKAKEYFNEALQVYTELDEKQSISSCLMQLGILFLKKSDFQKAEDYLIKSIEIINIKENKNYSACLNNLGTVYLKKGDFSKALELFSKSLKIKEENKDKRGIASSYSNLGGVYYNQGNYPKAVEYNEKSLRIREELEDVSGISYCLNQFGILYYAQGHYPKAIEFTNKSLKTFEQLGDVSGTSLCYNILGAIYFEQNDYPKAIESFEKSIKIMESIDDKDGISLCLNNLGAIYLNTEQYEKANECNTKSIKIREELKDKDGLATCYINKGLYYYIQGDYLKAIEYEKRAIDIAEELGLKEIMASDYVYLAKAYLKLLKPVEAKNFFMKSRQYKIRMISENFSILSEKEKELFLDKTTDIFNSVKHFTLTFKQQDSSLTSNCYNDVLLLKGLLLSSSQEIYNIVAQSKDTAISKAYWSLRNYRNKISALQSVQKNKRNENIDSLENLANEIERKLVKSSSELNHLQKQFDYKWQDVQKVLKLNEAAIEFTSYTTDNGKKSKDTTYYAALIIRPGYKYPEMIQLFNGDELSTLFEQFSGTRYKDINHLYGINTAKNTQLYNLIWSPIDKFLKNTITIYIAPEGLLNKISFAAIATPDGGYLSDKYKLNIVTTTAKIFNPEKFEIKRSLSASIYGGINYNSDSTKTETWKYLEGTKYEAIQINNLFKKNQIKTQFFSGKTATEEIFKQTGNNVSSEILHISTHGFFYPDPTKKTEEIKKYVILDSLLALGGGGDNVGYHTFVMQKNPMFRSGLILAGANDVWNRTIIDEKEDGVLTAYEVSNIKLNNTKLVVLSACETGLGDVRGSEGVYGLQRAFKLAGVNYIMMSLWQVPDKETSEFMIRFYDRLLHSKNIRKSFNETQKEMREKYDPFYWAAFVLIE